MSKNRRNRVLWKNKSLELDKIIVAIKQKCYDCSGYSLNEVKRCVIPHCPLFPYRLGLGGYKTITLEKYKSDDKINEGNFGSEAKNEVLKGSQEVENDL